MSEKGGVWFAEQVSRLEVIFCIKFGSKSVSEKHITYPSPNPTLNPTRYHLIVFSWVRGGVGVQLLRCLYSPPAERFGTRRWGVCQGLGTNYGVISPRPLAELCRVVLRKATYFLVGCADRVLADYLHFLVVFVPTWSYDETKKQDLILKDNSLMSILWNFLGLNKPKRKKKGEHIGLMVLSNEFSDDCLMIRPLRSLFLLLKIWPPVEKEANKRLNSELHISWNITFLNLLIIKKMRKVNISVLIWEGKSFIRSL